MKTQERRDTRYLGYMNISAKQIQRSRFMKYLAIGMVLFLASCNFGTGTQLVNVNGSQIGATDEAMVTDSESTDGGTSLAAPASDPTETQED
jgi:hypothetical protein